MPKEEWGVKRLCAACGARFYDLGRDPVDCPKCGATYTPAVSSAVKGRVSKATVSKVSPDNGDDEEDTDLIETDDDDDDDLESDSDALLSDDDDDDGDDVSVDDDDEDDLDEDVLLTDDDDDDDDDLGEFSKVDTKDKDI